MTATLSTSSGDYEKQQMELSRSYGSSVFDYSEDTFESFSEEEAACSQPESKPSQLHCSIEELEHSALSNTFESTSWLAGQSHTEEQSEVVDSAAMKRDFVRKMIDVVKNKEAGIKQEKSVIKTNAGITELSDGELDAVRSFCTVKIRRMQQGLFSKHASGGKARKQQHGFTSKTSGTSDSNCIVPNQLMNRIRLKNIWETIKQVTEAQVHKSVLCPDCEKEAAEQAEIAFLRQKKTLLERALLQEKLEEQIYSRDALLPIGEKLGRFPELSDDPRNLWQRLKDKAEGSPVNPGDLQLHWKDEGQKL